MLNCIDRWIDRLDGVYEPPCSTAETVDNIAGTLLHLGGDTPRHIAVVSTLRSGEPARCCSLLVERLKAMGHTACVDGGEDAACAFVFHPCDEILSQERSRPPSPGMPGDDFCGDSEKSSVSSIREACSIMGKRPTFSGSSSFDPYKRFFRTACALYMRDVSD